MSDRSSIDGFGKTDVTPSTCSLNPSLTCCHSGSSRNSTPSRRASFAAEGGTIGRASTNTLSLPDPQRTVSRVHAQILPRRSGAVIVSRSSNGLTVDDAPVEFGDEVPLKDGASIVIGNYTLRASVPRARRTDGSDDTTIRV